MDFVLSFIESFLSDFKRPLELYSFAMFYLMVLSTGTTALIASAFRVQIVRINVFYGKSLYSSNVLGFPVHFCSIPTGASVELLSDSHREEPAQRPGYRALNQLSRPKRVIIASSSLIGLGIFSNLSLGIPETFKQIISGFSQIVTGALDPCHTAYPLIREFFLLYEQSLFVASGLLSAKMISYQLIPLAGNLTWNIGAIYAEHILLRDSFIILFTIVNIVLLSSWILAFFLYSTGTPEIFCS